MALALYRKYRPRTFAEVIGQEHVTEPLSQALRSGRLHHAYLFSGPRGCGKTSSARILARSLNCEQGPTPEPCGVCASCRSLANDGAGSIDVIEIDAASHGGVDDARELREKAFFAPASSRYKIYVIDEAHMVSSAGFNALLKLVEEPPEYVKFIFATTEPEKVLGTIRSRTHHYPFRLIPPAVLRPYLQQLTEAEGIPVEPAVLPLVVRAGGGSARDSLSVLDQLIAGAGPDGVSYARAVALLGVTDVTLIDEMCDALAAGDGAAAYSTIDRVAEAGHDPRRFASDLLERFRDLIVLQQVPDAVAKGLIDGPADQLEAMGAQAARLGPATLSRCADIVHNGLVEMRGTTAPRLLLELVTARMLLPGADDSSGALLQRLERMERRLALGGEPMAPVERAAAPAGEPAPAAAAPAAAAVPAGAPAAEAQSSARAAALAVARRAGSGSGRAAPPAVAPAAPVAAPASASVPAVGPASAGEQDWNEVAGGPAAAARAAAPVEHDEEPPPWDDEEPVAPVEPVVPARAAAAAEPVVPAPVARAEPVAPAPVARAEPVVAMPVAPAEPVAAAPVAPAEPVVAAPVAPAEPVAAAPVARAEREVTSAAPAQAADVAAVEARTRRVEPAGVLPDAPEEPGAAAVEAVAAGPGQLTAQAVRQVWPEILAEVKRQPRGVVLRAMAVDATVRELEGQTVVLTVPSARHAQGITQGAPLIVKALYEVLGGDWEIRCEVAGEAGAVSYGAAPQTGQRRGAPPARPQPAQSPRPATAARTTPAAREPQNRRRPAEASASADDDWPEPARPGGAAAAPTPAEPVEEDGWPEVRQIGVAAPATDRPAGVDGRDSAAAARGPSTSVDGGGDSPGPRAGSAPSGDSAAVAWPVDGSGAGAPRGGTAGIAASAGAAEAAMRSDAGGPPGGSTAEPNAAASAGGSAPVGFGGVASAGGAAHAGSGGVAVPGGAAPAGSGGVAVPGGSTHAGWDGTAVAGGAGPVGSDGVASAHGPNIGGPGGGSAHANPAVNPSASAGGLTARGVVASGVDDGGSSGVGDGGWSRAGAVGGLVAGSPDGDPGDASWPDTVVPGASVGAGSTAAPLAGGSNGPAAATGASSSDTAAAVGSFRSDAAEAAGSSSSGAAAGAGSPGSGVAAGAGSPGSGVAAGAGSPGSGVAAEAGSPGHGPVADGSLGSGPARAAAASPGSSAARAAAASPGSGAARAAAGGSAGHDAGASASAPARPARNAAPSSGLAAARAAAAGARNAAARQTAKPANAAWSDGSPTEEAPYDPEFDGPPSGRSRSFEGFDPGDEPLDDVIDEKTARESSEQQAMRLLQEALGAEKIGES